MKILKITPVFFMVSISALFSTEREFLYRNNLKNREYGKEAAPIFMSGASDTAREQGASEGQKFTPKPMPPETDSSGCFGINKTFFQASQEQPYHLSIGAVLFDQNGRIACHHFNEILGHKDIYILMRESMEDNEPLLRTLHRGLKEEFGATAQPVAFLGSLSGYLPDPRLPFERAARAQSQPFKAELAELSDDLWQGTCHPIPERRISSVRGGVLQMAALRLHSDRSYFPVFLIRLF